MREAGYKFRYPCARTLNKRGGLQIQMFVNYCQIGVRTSPLRGMRLPLCT